MVVNLYLCYFSNPAFVSINVNRNTRLCTACLVALDKFTQLAYLTIIGYTLLTISLNKLIKIFRFMNSSLAKLASDCSNYNDGESMQLIHKAFTDRDKMRLAMRKGVFPYDYVNSWSRLNETQLPDKDKFFSLLKNEGISDEDYKHAHIIWNTFNHKTLKDYLKFYLKTDVLLLADIFENFRDICLKTYDLDPAHYYTVAGIKCIF